MGDSGMSTAEEYLAKADRYLTRWLASSMGAHNLQDFQGAELYVRMAEATPPPNVEYLQALVDGSRTVMNEQMVEIQELKARLGEEE
jgi:hypothetical protein